MRIGEAMEAVAAAIAAIAIFLLVATAVGTLAAVAGALLLVAVFVAYAAQMHDYSGSPVRRAKSA